MIPRCFWQTWVGNNPTKSRAFKKLNIIPSEFKLVYMLATAITISSFRLLLKKLWRVNGRMKSHCKVQLLKLRSMTESIREWLTLIFVRKTNKNYALLSSILLIPLRQRSNYNRNEKQTVTTVKSSVTIWTSYFSLIQQTQTSSTSKVIKSLQTQH